MTKRLTKIYEVADKILIDNNSKIVIMSDCHRGAGDNFDNFLKNRNIYNAALNYYLKNNFTYIELGDGDEMWEVKNYHDIVDVHLETFKYLKKFHDNNKLYMIYGNHDIVKKDKNILKEYFYKYYNNVTKNNEMLLDNLIVYESLVLKYIDKDIFLIHGHQVDFLNGKLWRISRFLVRTLWHTLETFGINDPTSAAKNYFVTKKIEKKLQKWSHENNIILIAGHTHRPVFPQVGNSLYFNDGSCIHPDGITCIEIKNGKIALIKWQYGVSKDGLIVVERKILESGKNIKDFFVN